MLPFRVVQKVALDAAVGAGGTETCVMALKGTTEKVLKPEAGGARDEECGNGLVPVWAPLMIAVKQAARARAENCIVSFDSVAGR